MEQGFPKGQILIVEDENIVAMDIRQSLNRLGYGVPAVASTGAEAVAAAQKWQPDLVLMDIRLRGEMDGIEAATLIRQEQHLPVVYLTAFADTATLDRAKKTEAYGYILKPFEDRELNSTIEMALYHHKMEKRLQENERWLDTTLRSIGDAVIVTDSVGRISFMNPVAEALTDCRSEGVRGMFFSQVMQILAGRGKARTVQVVQPQMDIKSVRKYEDITLVLPNQTSIPIDCTISSLLEEEQLVGSVVVLRDISRRKRAENALRTSEQRYRALFEQAEAALLTSELHNQINRSLMSSVNTNDVLQAIVDGVSQIIPAGYIFLHTIDPASGRLRPAVSAHSREERNAVVENDPDVLWPQLVRLVLEEKRPIHLRRALFQGGNSDLSHQTEGYLGRSNWNPFADHPLGSTFGDVATVPLIYRGTALGALTVISLTGELSIAEREMELMLVVANQATVAIKNARLFAEIEEKAAALSHSNAVLEEFAYVASHDMQEPLRMIRGYSQLLAQRSAGQDAEADDFLHHISESVMQLDTLIQDLLTYSLVGLQTDQFMVVDTEQILARALAALHSTIQKTQAVITHDPLPDVVGDEIQLGQLWQNLLSNALKFCRADRPRIHIQARQIDTCLQFSVADNGIGISSAFQEEIFAPLRRLHTRTEYPGSGIGLAICRKIVQAHSGRIWCVSEPGQGSTFFFTICTGTNSPKN